MPQRGKGGRVLIRDGSARTLARLALAVTMLLAILACMAWEVASPDLEKISAEVYPLTHTALAALRTEIADEMTRDAEMETAWAQAYTQDAATSAAYTPTTLGSHPPPVIKAIYFPGSIPGDGRTYHGELKFTDQMGDIDRLTIEVVQAQNFGGADYDPRPYLIYGTRFDGTYDLYIWCEGQQNVGLRVRLYDSMGGVSNPRRFDFECY